MVAGIGANVWRLTGVGSARDEATRVERQACKRGGGDKHHRQCQWRASLMTTMIIAVLITLLSMVGYHQRCNNHPAIPPPPCRLIFSCRKGGGTQLRLDRTAGGGWPFPSFSSFSSSFSFFSFSSIFVGPFEAMKMMTEEELVAAAAAMVAAPEAVPQLLPQSQRRRRGE